MKKLELWENLIEAIGVDYFWNQIEGFIDCYDCPFRNKCDNRKCSDILRVEYKKLEV